VNWIAALSNMYIYVHVYRYASICIHTFRSIHTHTSLELAHSDVLALASRHIIHMRHVTHMHTHTSHSTSKTSPRSHSNSRYCTYYSIANTHLVNVNQKRGSFGLENCDYRDFWCSMWDFWYKCTWNPINWHKYHQQVRYTGSPSTALTNLLFNIGSP